MKRKKRFTIKLVALGLTVAALAAPPAMAKLDEGLGVQTPPQWIVSSDDRAVSRMAPQPSQPSVVSPDDRMFSRVSPQPAAPRLVASDEGFELGTLGMSGIILVLGAGAAVVLAVTHSRKGKLASI